MFANLKFNSKIKYKNETRNNDKKNKHKATTVRKVEVQKKKEEEKTQGKHNMHILSIQSMMITIVSSKGGFFWIIYCSIYTERNPG